MAPTWMYPLDRRERAAVRRVLDADPLDRLFLDVLHATGWSGRSELQAAAGQPKIAARVPRWLASARRRGLIERRTDGHASAWRLTDAGNKRLSELQSQPAAPVLRPAARPH